MRQPTDSQELHPHMMYGALMSFLDSLYRSSWDVVPSVVPLGGAVSELTPAGHRSQLSRSARVVALALLIPAPRNSEIN